MIHWSALSYKSQLTLIECMRKVTKNIFVRLGNRVTIFMTVPRPWRYLTEAVFNLGKSARAQNFHTGKTVYDLIVNRTKN